MKQLLLVVFALFSITGFAQGPVKISALPPNSAAADSAVVPGVMSGVTKGIYGVDLAKNALATKLDKVGGTLTGTGGVGFIGFPAQSSAPSTPASGFNLYATSAGKFAFKRTTGNSIIFDISNLSADRTQTFVDADGTVATKEQSYGRQILVDNTQHANTASSTSENTVFTATIPANSIGANGTIEIRILTAWPSSANNKTYKVKLNGNIVQTVVATTSNIGQWMCMIHNRNATNSQVLVGPTSSTGAGLGYGTSGSGLQTYAIDMTASVTITVTIQNATSTESSTTTLEAIQVITYY